MLLGNKTLWVLSKKNHYGQVLLKGPGTTAIPEAKPGEQIQGLSGNPVSKQRKEKG